MPLQYSEYINEYGNTLREWAYPGDNGKLVRVRDGLLWDLIDTAYHMGWQERNDIAMREAGIDPRTGQRLEGEAGDAASH